MFFSAVYPIRPQSHRPRNQLATMAITWLVSCCWSLIEVTVKLVTKYPITVGDTTPVTISCYGKMYTLQLVGKWLSKVDNSCCEIGCKEMNGPKNLHVIALVVSSFHRRYNFCSAGISETVKSETENRDHFSPFGYTDDAQLLLWRRTFVLHLTKFYYLSASSWCLRTSRPLLCKLQANMATKAITTFFKKQKTKFL